MNRGVLRIAVMAVLVFIPSVRASQEKSEPNIPVSLQDYLRYAALNNAGLKAAFEQWKAAVEQVPQAESLPDPRFNYGYFIEEVETRVGPQRQKFGIMQVFPWFGKIEARKDAAAASAKAARKQYEARRLKLFFEVKEAFYEYTYLAGAIEIARENLELVKGFEEVVRIKYMATAATHPDFIRAQVELAKIEDVLKNLEDLREPIVARLNAVLNRGGFEMLPAKSKVELAKKKSYPDIGVGVDSIQTDGGDDAVILMFSLNLPIWRDSYKAAHRQAKANVRKTAQQKREKENTLIARAARVLYSFEDSERKIKLYGDILVPKAEELLGASETAYTGGTIDFLSLVDAQRTLLEFQLRYERAETDNQQKLANLEMLAGEELPVR